MDLFEYQARDIFEEHGVPVLQGTVATSPAEAREAAERIGGPVVVKAQVKIGGRGKAGGIRVAETPDAAHAAADTILVLVVHGHRAEKVMVVECVDIEEEYYFSILLDRAARTFLAMFSVEGGVDIEKLAEERPDAITRVEVDPLGELDAEALVAALPEDVRPAVIPASRSAPVSTASSTSPSPAPWASSATVPGWSCQPTTSCPARVRSTAGRSPRTSSTSAVVPPRKR